MSDDIKKLVAKYTSDRLFYRSARYNESQLRSDFLDPLFELLGWDIKNESALATNEREVVVEEALKTDDADYATKPDYTFRLHAERKFFLEAKKPCVSIESDASPALQVRRYGYTANLKISVLSNFEHLIIYDTTVKVNATDSSSKALVKKYHYMEYVEKFDEIRRLLGRESVYSGQFDEQWKNIETRVKHWSVDSQFLKQINEWRVLLGEEILSIDRSVDMEALNDVVQGIINKILFLRVCEDRNIETYQDLLSIAKRGHFAALLKKFKQADRRYNSGLFKWPLSKGVVCNENSSFWTIIRQLYYPETPYSFSVFSSDILGHIYEVFIAEKLDLVDGRLQIVKKPENVNRDVVPTPTFIVREILRRTVLPLCKGKSADELFKLKIADISCGSGAFLLEAFQLLNDSLIDFYIKHEKSRLVKTGTNTYKLKFPEKRKLLENCIFGVDKDFNAVEACQFGLLLKLLEGEDSASLKNQRPVLPDLIDNIHYGNSLLSVDDVGGLDDAVLNPFDFGTMKFDAIVGNPPYLSTEGMKRATPREVPLYKDKYRSAYKQFDKYYLFIERALELLHENGTIGYIVPLKFMKVGAGRELRRILSKGRLLNSVISFGACQVFSGKSNYTCLLTLGRNDHSSFQYSEVQDLEEWKRADKERFPHDEKTFDDISENAWVLFPDHFRKAYETLLSHSVKLSEITGASNIFNGIQTSATKVYVFAPKSENDCVYAFDNGGKSWTVEKEVTRPYFQTSRTNGSLDAYRTFKPNARVIFPYRKNRAGKLELIPLSEIKKEYPLLYGYLLAHKKVLASPDRDIKPRPAASDEWHRFGRHQSLDACNLPQKIIVGVLSTGGKYSVDGFRTFVSSGGTAGYCIIALPEESKYSIYYLQAILNSKYVEWLGFLHGEIFQGDFVARGTKVLMQLPVRSIEFSDKREKAAHDRIAKLQKDLIALGDSKMTGSRREQVILARRFKAKKRELDDAIMHLYGMEDLDPVVPMIKDRHATD